MPLQISLAQKIDSLDNILIAHEILSSLSKHRSKNGYMATKLVMKKAYDKLEQNFIKKYFIDLGFCERWVRLIMQSNTTTTFSIIMNEKAGSTIQPERGIWQDDPISTFIFIIST